MSQAVSGEGGGGGVIPHSSNKLLHHPNESPHGPTFSPPCQGGVLYNSYIPSVSIKSDSSQMENGFHPPTSLQQFNMQSSQMNPQYHQMQQSITLKGRSDIGSSYPPQPNSCTNVQYFPGGNYVTTVTVNPGEHYQSQVPVQYMQNPQNFYMNTGATMVNPGNNIKYFQSMMAHDNKNSTPNFNSQVSIGIASETLKNSGSDNTVTSDANNSAVNKNERKMLDGNINVNKNVSKTKNSRRSNNSNRAKPTSTSSEALCESSSVSERVNDNSVIKITSNSATSLRTCTSSSVSNVNNISCLNRPRTNSRCDSVRSETTESSCSSLSSESLPDQNHANHHNQLTFGMKNSNNFNNNNNPYMNNQVQTINNFNNNMNYQNYMACQARMNQSIGKPGMYNGPNVIQTFQQVNAFQHVQVQSGQVQLMQQQYPCIQGQNLVRPPVGMSPGNVSHTQTVPVMQNQNLPNGDQNVVLSQNSSMLSNCSNHSSSVVPQKICGSQAHGHFSQSPVMHSPVPHGPFSQQRSNVPACMMGIPSEMSVLNTKPFPGIVVVPFGWKRLLQNEIVVYVSPSGSELKSPVEVCEYLTQENTCKCGLQCPLRVENVFCFDPKVPHRLTMPDELSSGEATKMCNHRRKLAVAFSHHLHQKQAKKEDGRKKRKRKSDTIDDITPSASPSPSNFQEITNETSCEPQSAEQAKKSSDLLRNETQIQKHNVQELSSIQPGQRQSDVHLLQVLANKRNDDNNLFQSRSSTSIQAQEEAFTQPSTVPQPQVQHHSQDESQYNKEQPKSMVAQSSDINEQTHASQEEQSEFETQPYCEGTNIIKSENLEESHTPSGSLDVESRALPKVIILDESHRMEVQHIQQQQQQALNRLEALQSDGRGRGYATASIQNGKVEKEVHKTVVRAASNSQSNLMNITPNQQFIHLNSSNDQLPPQGPVVVSHSNMRQQVCLSQNQPQLDCSPPSQMLRSTSASPAGINTITSVHSNVYHSRSQAQTYTQQQYHSQMQQQSQSQPQSSSQSIIIRQHQQISPAMQNQTEIKQPLTPEPPTQQVNSPQMQQSHMQYPSTSEMIVQSHDHFKAPHSHLEHRHIQNSGGHLQHNNALQQCHSTKVQTQQQQIQITEAESQQSPQTIEAAIQQKSPSHQAIIQQQQHSQAPSLELQQTHMHLQAQQLHMRQQEYTQQMNPQYHVSQFSMQQQFHIPPQQMHHQLNNLQTQIQQQPSVSQSQILQNCNTSQTIVPQTSPQNLMQQQSSSPQPQTMQQQYPNAVHSQVQVHQQQSNTPQAVMQQQSSTPQPSHQVSPSHSQILSQSNSPHLQIQQQMPGTTQIQIQHQQSDTSPLQIQHQLPGTSQLQIQNLGNAHQSQIHMQHQSNISQAQLQHQSIITQPNILHQSNISQAQIQQQTNISQLHMLQHSHINHNQVGLQQHPMQPSMQQLQLTQSQVATQAQIQAYNQSQQPQFVKQQQGVHPQSQLQLPLCTMQVQGPPNQSSQPQMHHVAHLHQSSIPQQMPNHQFQMQQAQQQQYQMQHPNQIQAQQQFQHMQVQPQNRHSQGQMPYHQSQVQMQQMTTMQQHQQPVYQQNQNPNWHPVYGHSRLLVSNNGCQGNSEGFVPQPQSCGAGSQFPCQFPQGCENHNNPCFPANQSPKIMHHGIRPHPFGNRPAFCRAPGEQIFRGMIPSQSQMQIQPPHPMMGGMRPSHPFMNNNMMCRMPVHANHMHMYGNGGNINPPGPEGNISIPEQTTVHRLAVPEEGEKRKKGGGGRARKKAKTVIERNSPCPNVDVRNLRTENAASPHTGPGLPYSSTPQPVSLGTDTLVTSTCNANNRLTSQGQPVSGPSFMEDPNGYLAQQTALLNSTMSGGAVGQFSPQGPRVSPRPTCISTQNSPLGPPGGGKGFAPRSVSSGNTRTSLTSPTVVPLPSNVPLPARVSKAPMSTSVSSSATFTSTGSSACANVCSSVHAKSDQSCRTSPSPTHCGSQSCSISESISDFDPKDHQDTLVATAESSSLGHTITVTYTGSSVTTTTCGSESCSPQSSQDTVQTSLDSRNEIFNEVDSIECQGGSDNLRSKSSSKAAVSKLKSDSHKKTVERLNVSDSMSNSNNSRRNSNSGLSMEAANKPLTPGPAESTMNTQSPLEMVQNIVSSIPMPTSEELPPLPSRHLPNSQSTQIMAEQGQSMHQPMTHHQVLGPQVYNMTSSNGMTGVMYHSNGGPPGMLRGAGPLVVHGGTSAGSVPPGVIVSNSGNMVVVTSPFNSKVSVAAPVVTAMNSVVGVQTVPQVQVQSSMVHSHQLQSHLHPIQPVQPVVQLVNTFATMQTPVLIQNGSNIMQSPSGVLSSHGGVLGPASIIPNSTPTFVTSQPLLAVDSSSHSSQVQMAQVVTSASGENADDSCTNRLTPIVTPASTPTTPLSTPGSSQASETSPNGTSGGSGRKRKRRRNVSTPQGSHQSAQQATQPPNIMPAIIMGKQIPHHMVMNGAQISHYGNVTVAGNNVSNSANASHMLTTTGQPNSINVVQMVGGHMTGPMPVHLQQSPAIIVPSAATTGLIINQLPDGTFVSTDPTSGITYPVQLQLSGSHIVGVTPLQSANSTHNIVGSISGPSVTRGTMVAVRQQTSQPNSMLNTGAKLLNISPNIASQGEALVHNVYGVSASTPVSQSIVCSSANLCSTFPANLSPQQHTNQNTAAIQQPLLVGNGNGTLLQQKTTTIVAQQTTVVATQGGMMGTHSSVSTQTSGVLGESDVSSSDCVANISTLRETPISPSHQSAEVTTTRQDEDSVSTPESVLLTPPPGHSPEAAAKKVVLSVARTTSHSINSSNQEPHSASTTDDGIHNEKGSVVVWGAHRGHKFWPAQVIHQVGGEAAVQWFGDYQVEMVPLTSISKCPPKDMHKTPTRRSNRGRTALDKAIAEANEVELCDSFGDLPSPPSKLRTIYCTSEATALEHLSGSILALASSKLPGGNRAKKKKTL